MLTLRINYRIKSSLSIRMFIAELGQNFSDQVKRKLSELESRCFLTRKSTEYRFDLKHVEHIRYECDSDLEGDSATCKKEYAYAQFVVLDDKLYFSENCLESDDIMQSPMVSTIYNSLCSDGMIIDNNKSMKIVDDSNIDYIVDSILATCPQVSQTYLETIKGMVSRANNK
jgi:hypothetical protein